MRIRHVQLRQAVGLSQVIDAKDFEIELDLQAQVVLLKPKKKESFKFRNRIIPFSNVAAIEGFTAEEEAKEAAHQEALKAQAEADAQAMQPDPITVPVQPDATEPAADAKQDDTIIITKDEATGQMVEKRRSELFKKVNKK